MKQIASHLKRFTEPVVCENIPSKVTCNPKNATNERAYYIGLFTERINEERQGTQYKPLTARAIMGKLAHLNTLDIRDFYYQCEKSPVGFGRTFFGKLKI